MFERAEQRRRARQHLSETATVAGIADQNDLIFVVEDYLADLYATRTTAPAASTAAQLRPAATPPPAPRNATAPSNVPPSPPSTPPPPPDRPATKLIAEFVNAHPDTVVDAEAVERGTGVPRKLANDTLPRLAAKGVIKSAGYGKYQGIRAAGTGGAATAGLLAAQGDTIKDQVAAWIDAHPGPHDADAVHRGIGARKLETVRALLARLYADGRIGRPSHGKYERKASAPAAVPKLL